LAEKKQIVILVEDDVSVLRALRRLMISSGFDDQATRALIARINAVEVLIKAFSRDTLLTAITKALAIGRNPS
jgi:ActR/RegA family two-component response regulator